MAGPKKPEVFGRIYSMSGFHPLEQKVLLALEDKEPLAPAEIAQVSGLDINSVMRALDWLSGKGLVQIDEQVIEYISLGREGVIYSKKGLPERRAAEALKQGDMAIADLKEVIDPSEVSIAVGWLRKKDMATIENGLLRLTEKGGVESPDEALLRMLQKGVIRVSDLSEEHKAWIKPLASRQEVISVEEKIDRSVTLTPKGLEVVKEGFEDAELLGQLTHEAIKSGVWRDKTFREYDVTAPAAPALGAKLHPLSRMIEEIKEIFISMGFSEIGGPTVESNFWNFDALFVPQDHPAREMQDTFYLDQPPKAGLPDEGIVDSVSKAHIDGGGTGSRGWGYEWNKELASKTLLRTHTTATTIRHLAKRETIPIKVFSIGRVFRKERISYKHLPEFTQIEGIVVGDVSFKNLLGILKEFYSRMGFHKIRFRPAYFPYTEPSLEVEVFFEEKSSWIELGGAGIFRPEVYEPLGIEYPVLAWGLGLERLAMLRLDLKDIRALYRSDLDWLRGLPL